MIEISDFDLLLNYQGLIFDLDGTIVNSMEFHIKAWQEVGMRYGINIPTKYLADHGGVPSINIAKEINIKYQLHCDDQSLADQKTEAYVKHIPEISIYHKMKLLLEFARNHKIPMIIGTGTLRSNVEKILKSTELEHYIDRFVCSDQVKRHKPHPDTFIEAAKMIDCEPIKCLVFEDAPLGVQAAANGGLDCCIVNNGSFDLSNIIKS